MTNGPDPSARFPIAAAPTMVFLKPVVSNPQIEIGEFTYYHDDHDPEGFEKNVLYAFPFIGDRLVIGKFCAIASGATFMLNGGNHHTETLSSFPFGIFGQGWETALPDHWPNKGDLVVGHDVWIGQGAVLTPGVKIGSGAVIAARSVVTSDVPPYAIVGGNPARVIRMRRSEAEIERLLALAWWDWPITKITRLAPLIAAGDLAALEQRSS
jgi:virginiamycin A acetyltransferase